MTSEILIAGFGGQGILFAGKLLSYVGLIDGKEVSWLPSYGPAMRGGTCNCSVCVSDKPIGSPLVLNPDALIVMNAPSCDKFIGSVKEGGKAFIDSSFVGKERGDPRIDRYYIPATELARDNGLKGMANIIMLGKMIKETGLASFDAVKRAAEKTVPAGKADLVEANMRAIEIGAAN
ncbi:MAG: 2-oxoacid:acceptor oxidoreductase family protein [Oscillospiraceae bacterium]|jgi:2-oxoglutarate ferredoxin oxidoreductase subunit gamma|nr:2-oxoacid:acceptor oxidoreductase family protein [Oscillospiraceae bacterium]